MRSMKSIIQYNGYHLFHGSDGFDGLPEFDIRSLYALRLDLDYDSIHACETSHNAR